MNLLLKFCNTIYPFIASSSCCVRCGNFSYVPICISCDQIIRNSIENSIKRCSICGRQLISEKTICVYCRRQRIVFNSDFVLPLFSYELWNKNLLFEWKINKKRHLALFFSKYIHLGIEQIRKHNYFQGTYIVPVPARPNKIRREGWDQIDDLTRLLHENWKYNLFPVLRRITTKQQKHLNRFLRLHNENNYCIHTQFLNRWQMKHAIPEEVILIDDVMTTGVTIENCARLLKEIGIRKVFVITLFIAE